MKAWDSCRTIRQRNPDDGGWSMEGGGEREEVSKLVNPMISCCSCPSLHQVPLQNRGMERTSAGATKDECRRY
jgi:hypothetical protein